MPVNHSSTTAPVRLDADGRLLLRHLMPLEDGDQRLPPAGAVLAHVVEDRELVALLAAPRGERVAALDGHAGRAAPRSGGCPRRRHRSQEGPPRCPSARV